MSRWVEYMEISHKTTAPIQPKKSDSQIYKRGRSPPVGTDCRGGKFKTQHMKEGNVHWNVMRTSLVGGSIQTRYSCNLWSILLVISARRKSQHHPNPLLQFKAVLQKALFKKDWKQYHPQRAAQLKNVRTRRPQAANLWRCSIIRWGKTNPRGSESQPDEFQRKEAQAEEVHCQEAQSCPMSLTIRVVILQSQNRADCWIIITTIKGCQTLKHIL